MSEQNENVVNEVDDREIEALRKQMSADAEKLSNRDEDVAGYWKTDKLPADVIPRSVRLFDGHLDKSKFSALIIAEAVSPTVVEYTKEKIVYQKLCKKGDMIGIFYKAGMKAIAMCCGVRTIITDTGEKKDIGKGNPMQVFSVRSANGGTLIPITNDSRHKSASQKTPFDVKQADDMPANAPPF